MREFIKNALVEVHRNCTTDQYGQMGKFNLSLNNLFGKRAEEVEDYLKVNPILKISTYGASYGTYKAIWEIVDPEIKKLCREAFALNENRIRNINSY